MKIYRITLQNFFPTQTDVHFLCNSFDTYDEGKRCTYKKWVPIKAECTDENAIIVYNNMDYNSDLSASLPESVKIIYED